MTILKDISDTLKDAVNIAKELDIKMNKQTSIAKLSSAATLQFPVITSRSINVDTTQTIVKALERQYAIFVQLVISMNPYLDLEKEKNLRDTGKNKYYIDSTYSICSILDANTNVRRIINEKFKINGIYYVYSESEENLQNFVNFLNEFFC